MERLFEMANYYKEDLELPVNIWLDENETYKLGKHGKRIKFQINYMDKIREEYMCPMMLDGEIPPKVYKKLANKKDWEISTRDLERVRNFVINNAYALDFMCDQKLRRKDFDNIVIKGGNFASDEEVENQVRLVDELSR
jgi:hypothetical protein